jgi:membrane protein implicated in regulation of membrane protease activity
MQPLWDIATQFGAWGWFGLAVILFVLESIVPGVHFIWFGLSAEAVGVIALILHVAWQWQLIAFALIALAAVFWVRRQSREESSHPDVPDLNVRGAQYIGRVVTVEDDIANGRGRVRVGDTVWLAEGEDAAKGSRVKVTGVSGTALVVQRLGA